MADKITPFMWQETESGKTIEIASDEKGNLYIDGRKIVTTKVVHLRWFELTLLSLTTVAVITQAIMDVFSYFK